MTIAFDADSRLARRQRWVSQAVRRFATIGDQLFVALSNFTLTLSISRAFGAEEIASYGIGLSLGLMIQGLQRHAITIPLMLQTSRRASRRSGGILAQHTLVLLCALLLGVASIFLTKGVHAEQQGMLIAESSAVCLLVYSELEFARAILIKLDRPISALSSAVYYSAVCVLLAIAAQKHWISYTDLLTLLSIAMILHVVALGAAIGRFDLGMGARLFISDWRRYGGWAFVATATYSGYNHLPLLILAALTAPAQAAAFVATRSLMQPLQVLLRGLDVADKAFFSDRARSPHSKAAFDLTLKLAIPYICAAGLFGAIVSIYSSELITLAYGSKFADANTSLQAWIPVCLLMSASFPFESLIYSRNEFRRYYLVRAFASVIAVTLTVPLVLLGQSVGAILACAVGSLIAMSGTVIILKRGGDRI
jgi:O-antigen/teichoic acid export membrane protein